MNRNVILILLICLNAGSCKKNKQDDADSQLSTLKAPKIILNEFAKGEFAEKITSIRIDNSDNTTEDIYITYKPDSKKIETLLFQGKTCFDRIAQTVFYNSNGLIDRIESVENYNCDGTTLKIFKYNYTDGYLKSIISNNTVLIFEQYFSYNEDGTIEKLLSDNRSKSEMFNGYTETKFEYDNRGNISRATANPISDYDVLSVSYTHDDKINPLRGFIFTPTFKNLMTGTSRYSKNNVLSDKAILRNGNISYSYRYLVQTDSNNRAEKLHIDPLPEYWLVYNFIYN